MSDTRTFGNLTVRIGGAPPVYDPGPTWVAIGPGTDDDFLAVEAAARGERAAQIVVPNGAHDVLKPLDYRPVSDFWRGTVDGSGDAASAREDDLPFLLDLAAARRQAYEPIHPVFWRPAADARAKQDVWFRHLLDQRDARVLRLEDGFLVATRRGDGPWEVDDFCVVTPDHWHGAGARLLASLEGPVVVVCACHDEPKQALMRAMGLEVSHTWFHKPLDAGGDRPVS